MTTKKGTWESIFGHLGTPDEAGNYWLALSRERDLAVALNVRYVAEIRKLEATTKGLRDAICDFSEAIYDLEHPGRKVV